MESSTPASKRSRKHKINLPLDLRLVCVLLLLVIAGMLAMWRPWTSAGANSDRTIQVTGEAIVKAEPDEYLFYPTYEFKGTQREDVLQQMTAKSQEITQELKKLGVEDRQIKTNANDYDYRMYKPEDKAEGASYTLQLTITVSSKDMAQKVQDYLLSTSPSGSVTPQASFSTAKRKELERQARDEATKEARSKAEQSAQNLGFRVGNVQSVNDGTGFGISPLPALRDSTSSDKPASATQSLPIQQGENELHYSVTVTYYLR